MGDSPEVGTFTKYGGYVPLTLELIDRDQTRKLKAYARELGAAGLRKISSLVAAIFTANCGGGADHGGHRGAVQRHGGDHGRRTRQPADHGAWPRRSGKWSRRRSTTSRC